MTARHAPGQIAIDHLIRITEEDPLYRPAQFFLAYATLMAGYTQKAQELFAALVEPYNEQASVLFDNLKEQWPRVGLRHGWIFRFKPIRPILLPWLKRWQHITALVSGGTLYRMSRYWAEFDQRLAQFEDAKGKSDPEAQIERISFQV